MEKNKTHSMLITIFVMSLFVIMQGCDLIGTDSEGDNTDDIGGGYTDNIENIDLSEEVIFQINSAISSLAGKESEEIDQCSCLDAIFGKSDFNAYKDEGMFCGDIAIINNNNVIDVDLDFSRYTLLMSRVVIPNSGYKIKNFNLLMNRTEKKYYLKIDLETSEGGYAVVTPLYYWQVYDKLDSSCKFETQVNILQNSSK